MGKTEDSGESEKGYSEAAMGRCELFFCSPLTRSIHLLSILLSNSPPPPPIDNYVPHADSSSPTLPTNVAKGVWSMPGVGGDSFRM